MSVARVGRPYRKVGNLDWSVGYKNSPIESNTNIMAQLAIVGLTESVGSWAQVEEWLYRVIKELSSRLVSLDSRFRYLLLKLPGTHRCS